MGVDSLKAKEGPGSTQRKVLWEEEILKNPYILQVLEKMALTESSFTIGTNIYVYRVSGQ